MTHSTAAHAAEQASLSVSEADERLRIGVDMSILRRPPSGSARWARGLYRALGTYAPRLTLLPWGGSARIEWGGPLRKGLNLARDRFWYDLAIPLRSRQQNADALLMPVNLTARLGAPPQVVTIHDVNFLSAPGTYDPGYTRYISWAIRRALASAAAVTTVSHHSRAELVRWFGADSSRVEVIHPGLDPVRPGAADRSPLDEPYALFVGPIEPHKNVPLILRAWAEPELSRALRLVIVGPPGRDHARVLELAQSLRPAAVVTGTVDRVALDRWYRWASLFLFPSQSEGFGFPPLEAMQHGVPVIAARAGSLPEVLGDAALFHEPTDVESLIEAVKTALGDAALRSTLIARGHERVTVYRWEDTAAAMAAVLARVAGQAS